jgi:hypothetical protein
MFPKTLACLQKGGQEIKEEEEAGRVTTTSRPVRAVGAGEMV